MFTIGIHTFFVVYVVIALVVLTGLALRESWRRSLRDERKNGDNLCVCSECRHVFLVRHETTARCPRCGQLGKAGGSRRRNIA